LPPFFDAPGVLAIFAAQLLVAAGVGAVRGWRTTLIAPSCFFWNIS
jgi:hypothetical protein